MMQEDLSKMPTPLSSADGSEAEGGFKKKKVEVRGAYVVK
jgi:hypothetical protein